LAGGCLFIAEAKGDIKNNASDADIFIDNNAQGGLTREGRFSAEFANYDGKG